MTLKAKLISTISAFVLILTMLIVGVWAASTANVTLGGTVGFKADNVYAKVSATVSGMEENPTLPTLIFSEGADASSETDVEKWSDLDLLFNSSATPIEISVTVENLSTERWLLVDIIEGLDNGKSDNINKEVKKENSDYALGEPHTLVPSTGDGTSKVEFTITLTVDNSNYSADTIYSYIINLNNSNEEPPEPTKELDFIFSGNKVTGYTGNETNITIPTSYSMEKTPYNSFVLTAGESLLETPEARNKMAMLYALKNYTVYLNGQSEGVFCENFADYESLQGRIAYPFRVKFSEDLTFELTEAEVGGGQETEETEFKLAALELLQNFYVQFGENSEEILYQDYVEFSEKFSEIMLDPKPEYFPLKFRIDYASYKYVEGDDYQVEAIGEGAFHGCSSLTSITIPEGVTSIYDFAFSYCSSLTTISIPEGVTSIGNYAFEACISLTSVSLPSTLTSIGKSAFSKCSSLTSITIPEGVTKIYQEAFQRCTSLTSVSLPSTLTSIGDDAFDDCSSLTSISIPEGVTSIGWGTFSDCSSLTSITIPSTLPSIGFWAFSGCYALAIVYNNSSLTIDGSSNCGYLGQYAKEIVNNGEQPQGSIEESGNVNYYINETTGEYIALAPSISRDLATQITIAAGAKEINRYAFIDCWALETVIFEENSQLTSIGDYAFDDCSSLTSISLPSTLTSIGMGAFQNCNNLNYYTDSNNNKYLGNQTNNYLVLIDIANTIISEFDFPAGCKIIYYGAFSSCSLTSITIPAGVTSIGNNAFLGCSNLTSVTIEGVTSIGDSAFFSCSSLTSITIPEGVTSIGNSAFWGCSSLAEITINGNISTLGSHVFDGCQNLTKLTLGSNVTSLPDSLFGGSYYNLTNLTEIVVEAGSTLSAALPTYGTWVKDEGSDTQTNFSGAGTYTRTDV